jgi:hypothetical protein
MAQAVSRRPLTAEPQGRVRVSPCGTCGGQGGTATGFSPNSSGFLCQYHFTVALHTQISSVGRTIGPLVAEVRAIVSPQCNEQQQCFVECSETK